MTHTQTNYIKENWMNFSTLVVVVSFVIFQSKWQQKVDSHIEEYKEHSVNQTLHMPFAEKIQVFVPRVELDSRLENMETFLSKIDNKLNDLKHKK